MQTSSSSFDASPTDLAAIDRDGLVHVADATVNQRTARLVVVSAYGADRGGPPGYTEGWWKDYYAAKQDGE